jgi:heme A synthase
VLIRLRFFHPFIAVAVSAALIFTARLTIARRQGEWIKRLATALIALVIVQLAAGLINLLLHAPIWLQLVHLLLSDLIWIVLSLLVFQSLAQPARIPAADAIRITAAA